MKNKHLLLSAVLLPALLSGCGLEIFQDWQNSQGEAMPGAGAIAGQDYIMGLEPSTDARDYFSMISDDKPLETVSRTDGKESKYGVKFVNDGGIVIPPGVTIAFDNQGYCMDPNLPAPKAGDEYQFVPMKRLIPTELQGTYKRLIAQESAGSSDVKMNMQRLVWAMRTAGTESVLANSLTSQQKQILDRCSDYAGQFESFNESAKSSNQLRKELNKMFDSLVTVKIGDVTYTSGDLLNPEVGMQKISDHVNHLIELGDSLPVENTGFNYGELEPGIYTDIQGTGSLKFHARIANSTDKPFTFYPSDYIGQVGSPAKSSGLFASADSSMRQRVTGMNQNKVNIVGVSRYDESKYNKKSGQITGMNEFRSPKDLANRVNRVSKTNEVVGEIYKKDGKYYVSDFKEVGDSGGTRPRLSGNAVAGIHSHPGGGNISPADIATVLSTGKPELIVDTSTGKIHVLTEREARQAWNEIGNIYKEQTGKNIPNYNTVSSDPSTCVSVDKAVLDYRDAKQSEILNRRDARKEELKNREYKTNEEIARVNEQWRREEQAFKNEYDALNNVGSIPLTERNEWGGTL